ncbi:HAD family phosphatase [Streptomyces hayashii]|uniref:HAD family phosphatase n=1 Tax=Streptomyces hayashii TaxID=2839966 RepID=UPI00403C9712
MPVALRHLRLAAVNIDGVLLDDTFSPVIREMVIAHGGDYSSEAEYALLSQPQIAAATVFAEATGTSMRPEELLAEYLARRDAYVTRHPVRVREGAGELLRSLRDLGLKVVCYGGLDRSHFDRFLGPYAPLFDGPGYVCTDGFRPGVHEITREVFGLGYDRAVFVDDVARVTETARSLGVPFIGHPSAESAHQRRLMAAAGVRHMVGALGDIDESLLRTVDDEAANGTVWRREPDRDERSAAGQEADHAR